MKILISQKIAFVGDGVDTGEKTLLLNIFTNFRNNSKWPPSVLKEVAENLVWIWQQLDAMPQSVVKLERNFSFRSTNVFFYDPAPVSDVWPVWFSGFSALPV